MRTTIYGNSLVTLLFILTGLLSYPKFWPFLAVFQNKLQHCAGITLHK